MVGSRLRRGSCRLRIRSLVKLTADALKRAVHLVKYQGGTKWPQHQQDGCDRGWRPMSDQPSKAGGDWENPHERGVQAKDASNEKDGQTEKRQEQNPGHDAEPKGARLRQTFSAM